MSPAPAIFRCSFLAVFLVILIAGLFVAGLILIPTIVKNGRLDPIAAVAGILAGEAAALVWTVPCVMYFTIRVSPAGLYGFDFWGRYHEVAWDSITRAVPVNFLGLKFLRVFAPQLRRPLWLPLFLNGQDRFMQMVRTYAGPKNLLTRILWEN